MQKISPCLWFDHQAEEAANFYVSVFPNSRVVSTTRYVEGLPQPAGTVMTMSFILDCEEFVTLNGGPVFQFTPAVSFVVHCETQAEVDRFWQGLTEGGAEGQCGWLTDRYGVSWQIVPNGLIEMFKGSDTAASQRAVAAMLQKRSSTSRRCSALTTTPDWKEN